jgi:hypothetical protein
MNSESPSNFDMVWIISVCAEGLPESSLFECGNQSDERFRLWTEFARKKSFNGSSGYCFVVNSSLLSSGFTPYKLSFKCVL